MVDLNRMGEFAHSRYVNETGLLSTIWDPNEHYAQAVGVVNVLICNYPELLKLYLGSYYAKCYVLRIWLVRQRLKLTRSSNHEAWSCCIARLYGSREE